MPVQHVQLVGADSQGHVRECARARVRELCATNHVEQPLQRCDRRAPPTAARGQCVRCTSGHWACTKPPCIAHAATRRLSPRRGLVSHVFHGAEGVGGCGSDRRVSDQVDMCADSGSSASVDPGGC